MPDPQQPDYSVIIPAFNESAELPRTLAALRLAMSAQREPGEVIVVDNGSDDGTAELARAHGADCVVEEPFKQIARARNRGAAAARSENLIFLDADTRIEAPLLAQTLERLRSGDAGGGSVIRFEGTAKGQVGRFGIWAWERVSRWTRTAAGSYLYCRKEAFEAVGGFDQRLFAGEEIRLSRLLKRWGRAEAREFRILTTAPAETSARKLEWYSGPQILGWVVFVMVFPVAVRWRRLCGFWYRRPREV